MMFDSVSSRSATQGIPATKLAPTAGSGLPYAIFWQNAAGNRQYVGAAAFLGG